MLPIIHRLARLSAGLITLLCATELMANQVKAAFVYVGPANPVGWSHAHELGRQAIERRFGDQVSTHFVEFVPEGRASRKVLQQLADDYDIVFATSLGYMIPSQSIARQNPEVKFEHATGNRRADNLANYATRAYQPRYLAGLIAGHMSRSGKIGYVAAHAVPEVIRGINAFTLGVKAANPAAEVEVRWTKAWYAPELAAQLAHELLDNGADILTHHTDSPAVAKVAEQRQAYVIGYHSDMSDFAPTAHLASVIHDWEPYYVKRIQALLDNRWQASSEWTGMKDATSKLVNISPNVPDAIRLQIEQAQQQIISGDKPVFSGPIVNHRGRTRVKPGEQLSDDDLDRMNWYVDGVKGALLFF